MKKCLSPEGMTKINNAMPSEAKYGEVFKAISEASFREAYKEVGEELARIMERTEITSFIQQLRQEGGK